MLIINISFLLTLNRVNLIVLFFERFKMNEFLYECILFLFHGSGFALQLYSMAFKNDMNILRDYSFNNDNVE
jgi:hypothetical protein